MAKTSEKIISGIETLADWQGRVVSWFILIITGAICYEVVSRYVFSSPTDWAYEFTSMVYGAYAMLLGAYTHRHEGHIRMDVVYHRFSRRTQIRVDFVTNLLALGFLIIFFVTMTKFAISSWEIREFSSTSTWAAPLYPFKTVIALGVLFFLLMQIAVIYRNVVLLKQKEEVPVKV
jgi:TRAP-type mannitol/chloroaromatic compound transport system permease small subunit